ncbi:hypothetical protein Tco_1245014 [Tanacetum coccineum]
MNVVPPDAYSNGTLFGGVTDSYQSHVIENQVRDDRVTHPVVSDDIPDPAQEEGVMTSNNVYFIASFIIVRQNGAMWAVHLKLGKGEGWCWIAQNECHKFRQYGTAIKAADRVPTTTKFNVIRVLNK